MTFCQSITYITGVLDMGSAKFICFMRLQLKIEHSDVATSGTVTVLTKKVCENSLGHKLLTRFLPDFVATKLVIKRFIGLLPSN